MEHLQYDYSKAYKNKRTKIALKRWGSLALVALVMIVFIEFFNIPSTNTSDFNNVANQGLNHSSQKIPEMQIESSKIYGHAQNPKGRIVALVNGQEKEVSASWGQQIQNRGVNATVYSQDQSGTLMARKRVTAYPAADLDGDLDVDIDDLKQFNKKPIDLDLNGKIDANDHKDLESWVGWKLTGKK